MSDFNSNNPGSYIRVFVKSPAWSRTLGLNTSDIALLMSFILRLQAGGLVLTDPATRNDIMLELGISERTLYRGIRSLKEREILFHGGINKYYLNPRLAWYGSEKERKELLRETK